MFNLDKFGFKAAPKAETASVEPQNTDSATMEVLQTRIKEVIAQSPEHANLVNDFDVAQIAKFMAIAQEKTGTPFTADIIENSGPDFNEHLLASVEGRVAAKPSAPPAYQLVNSEGFVVGHGQSRADIERIAEEGRAN